MSIRNTGIQKAHFSSATCHQVSELRTPSDCNRRRRRHSRSLTPYSTLHSSLRRRRTFRAGVRSASCAFERCCASVSAWVAVRCSHQLWFFVCSSTGESTPRKPPAHRERCAQQRARVNAVQGRPPLESSSRFNPHTGGGEMSRHFSYACTPEKWAQFWQLERANERKTRVAFFSLSAPSNVYLRAERDERWPWVPSCIRLHDRPQQRLWAINARDCCRIYLFFWLSAYLIFRRLL